ncbi:uncharacterized protein [Triticum aestivum]|uniref:uncharacterized protein n=2 Tax=Triticum TaxID=4564 RepID=UPI001D01D9D9|nr:uncharacterized protein LOC123137122 [Triticum aestivum]
MGGEATGGVTPRAIPRVCPRGTAEAAAAPCLPAAARAGIGGRFWALMESDNEDDAGDGDLAMRSPLSPTPSSLIGDLFHAGYDEDAVANNVDTMVPVEDPVRVGLHPDERREVVRRVVHRRNAASTVRPWKGPIPKVLFRTTALIRSWSPLTQTEAREHLVTGSVRWEMVARDIFDRFGWRSCNRIGI